jgi:hypothetical protein
MIIYLHGFGSNGNAFKARLLKRIYPGINIFSPDLSIEPIKAITFLEKYISEQCHNIPCLVVGSSLGGFYALHLHVRFNLPAVLLNPTVQPVADLERRIKNDSDFDPQGLIGWNEAYLDEFSDYYHDPNEIRKDNLTVYLNRDDELLDYRIAENYFQPSGCKIILNDKGGHVFLNFTEILPEIISVYDRISNKE